MHEPSHAEKYTIAHGYQWQAIYVDGELALEVNHMHNFVEVVEFFTGETPSLVDFGPWVDDPPETLASEKQRQGATL